jgi:hypothetical protein
MFETPSRRRKRALESIAFSFVLFTFGATSGCGGEKSPEDTTQPEAVEQPAEADLEIPAASVPRLTAAQYRNSVQDIFGEDIITPPTLEPDIESGGFTAIGAGISTVSPRGVELYEEGAYAISVQLVAEDKRERLTDCAPFSPQDEDCFEAIVDRIGPRLFRRPIGGEERAKYVALGKMIGGEANDFWVGARYMLAAMLQSPNFLWRGELGTPKADGSGRRTLNNYELASRLSFFLWNTTPDEALLEAAREGELSTSKGLEEHTRRMLEDDRAKVGMRAFFSDIFDLDALLELTKDPTIYKVYSPELGLWAREQTLLTIEDLIFEDQDFRTLMNTRETYLNRKLASMYGVVSPTREGFARTTMPEDSQRFGLIGHASVLSLYSHPVSTSATLRGKFIRERLLCDIIPSPPADVDTSIPEPSGETPTLRDRVAEHLENPSCAGCHNKMDPIGLALENFDGVGVWREDDDGHAIDPSGNLDGEDFTTPAELADLLTNHPRLTRCMVQHAIQYSTGNRLTPAQQPLITYLDIEFAASEFRFKELIVALVLSPIFRETTAPSDDIDHGADAEEGEE